ncbi:MAG: crossover junction endodeoxyribonuclease RuvC [Candidatus Omnitrophica bacterium]|nr:crossover junction endodeoxyribonuclease RuvC [Candidatus Omnitrophota bacterium]
MRILGVDPALAVCGYGIVDFNNNRLSLCKAGAVITSYRKPLPERLNKIYETFTELIRTNRPEVMVLEKIYVHYHHPTTAYLLGQARGIILLACAKGNIPLVEYAATRVKKAIVGKGLASKEQVQRMVKSILNLNSTPKYLDVTDALALAIAYSYFIKADTIKQGVTK